MARRLRVYRTTAGFQETMVAAPNQGEALNTWSVRQSLFVEGVAEAFVQAPINQYRPGRRPPLFDHLLHPR
jgi:hypothetical protein